MSEIWDKAQQLESQWWKVKKNEIISQDYREQIKKRAQRIESMIDKQLEGIPGRRVLEIGGGATQLIDFFREGEKYAVDPLADMYQAEFAEVLAPGTKWHKAKAENMPFENDFFDIIVIRNVLDHVDSVDKAISEMRRVLKNSGILYLGMNTFSGPYYIYKLIVKDPEHPHTFTPGSIRSCIIRNNLNIVDSIADAKENMVHFTDRLAVVPKHKAVIRDLLFAMDCFHFSEFLLRKV